MDNSGLSGIDQILHSFLLSKDEVTSQNLLEQLMTQHVEPVIDQTIRQRLRQSLNYSTQSPERSVEDVCSETRVSVLKVLRQLKEIPDQKPIGNFRGYVRAIVFQVWDKQLRQMHPQRWRLKNQIRYLLNHHSDFSLWETNEGLCAGKKNWSGQNPETNSVQFQQLLEKPESYLSHSNLITLIQRVFRHTNHPIELDTLVSIAARCMGVTTPKETVVLEFLPDEKPDFAERYEHRSTLERLWKEICALPQRQKLTIILGLREESGRTLVPLLPLLGVATMAEIAFHLNLTIEELARIWKDLPIEDAKIADLLKITRQQVVNLRKSAKERLARRLKGNQTRKLTSLKVNGEKE